ncbi:A2ML1 protein, partial [Podargus strigoides]|nr:A2ML1 protein [Podargus strigoides]
QTEKVFFLHVLIHSGDNVLFEGHKKVLVEPPKNVIVVETDKVIYKPGETGKARSVTWWLCVSSPKQDPEGNRIAEWVDVKPRRGIVDLSFPLASEAALGMYTISVQRDVAQKVFEVAEYVLEKFGIQIKHPPFITTADEEFQLEVCGKYTYGKPVQGKIDINFLTLFQYLIGHLSMKTEDLELSETDLSIFVIGKMVEDGTGTGEHAKPSLPCRQLLWVWPFCSNFSSLCPGAEVMAKAGIPIATRLKSIEFINLHSFYKRGLPYTGKLEGLRKPSARNNIKHWWCLRAWHNGYQLPPLYHLLLIASSIFCAPKGSYNLGNDSDQDSSASDRGIEDSFHWLKPFYSESNSFLEIQARDDVMPCGEEQEVQVDYILDPNKLSSEADHGSFSLTLTIGNDFLPDINLLLYTVFSDGEVVADTEEFEVEKCFRHKVTLDFSHKEEVPGSKVTLDLKAAPGSLCSVKAVDKSVLLKNNNTLTANTVSAACQPPVCLPSELRMKILTNTRIKKPVSCILPGFEKKMYHAKENVVAGHSDSAPHSDNTRKPEPRTLFPETWIWDLLSVGDDGQTSVHAAVPDTITEWNANAFCVADVGFGLSHLSTLRAFKPFFVDLALPYSVIQGETFSLKATVFNYLKDCIQVHTSLTETPELKVEACPDCHVTRCLCANEAKTFEWKVTATKLGEVKQRDATAAGGRRGGICLPMLAHRAPGGVSQEKTQNAFLCAADNTVSEEFPLELPEEVLEGSGRATFSVIGDIMGPALQNLDRLLELPFGCGEQNMVQFAPNIFVLQYLNKTKQLDSEIKGKALKFLRTGYQRELLYKHDDGSYSAFGKGDDQGNTWLTAFVARSFGQASSHIYIDKDHVHDALVWLQKHQLPSGCFQSVGKLFNNDLKGGVDDTISLTAYITAALVELQLEKNDTMLDNALRCLKNVTLDKASLYVKALMAYVFTLSKDMEMREQLLEMLEKETADVHRVLLYHMFLPPSAELLTSRSSSKESSSSMIETVAYILLAHVSKPDLAFQEAAVSKLVRWLSGQRNSFGGFASTQDTVVSLQALAQYAALIPQEIRDVKVTVKGKEAPPLEFHVHRNNKLILHQASLLAVPDVYTVQATGSGCIYVQKCFLPHQTTLHYNIPPPKAEEVFVLGVETVPTECDGVRKQFDIRVSVSYTGDRETSNMALVDVEMLSGFIPVKSSVKELAKIALVKKTEIKPDKVTIYLEELGETSLKLNISVEQDVEVKNLKAATVYVYDYYKP